MPSNPGLGGMPGGIPCWGGGPRICGGNPGGCILGGIGPPGMGPPGPPGTMPGCGGPVGADDITNGGC